MSDSGFSVIDYFTMHQELIRWFESSFIHYGIPCNYYFVHTPSLALYSLVISVVSLVSFMFRNILDILDYVMLRWYTFLTRRIHLPKHRTPKQFAPSISFMGGKFYQVLRAGPYSASNRSNFFSSFLLHGKVVIYGCSQSALDTISSKILI